MPSPNSFDFTPTSSSIATTAAGDESNPNRVAESSGVAGAASQQDQLTAVGREDGSNALAQLLQAVLEEHQRVVLGLAVENYRLRKEFNSAAASDQEHYSKAALDDTGAQELSTPTVPLGSDKCAVKEPAAGTDECDLEQEDDLEADLTCRNSGSDVAGTELTRPTIDGSDRPTSSPSDMKGSVSVAGRRAAKDSVKSILLRHQSSDLGRRCTCEKFVDGPFEKICSVLIMLFVVFVFIQLQFQGYAHGASLGLEYQGMSSDSTAAFRITELVFNICFAVEFVIRVCVLRTSFFFGHNGVEKLHIFDTFLVLASCFDVYLSSQGGSSGAMNVAILRPFRFLRLLRTLRVIETVKLFEKLRELVKTTIASVMAGFWSLFLLVIVMLMAALFLCQSLSSTLEDEAIALETRVWVFKMYGTSARAFYTLFELTFSGGWPNYARTLVEDVSAVYAVFFFIYIIAVTFAMFRVITALFLRDTLALASSDAEIAVQQKTKQKEGYARKLLEFFQEADTSNDGFLSLAEFEDILSNDRVKTWLSLMELEVHDTQQLFKILDEGDGVVSAEEFVNGILRLKGNARSQDVMCTMLYCRKLMNDVSGVRARLDRIDCRLVESQAVPARWE